MRVDKLLHSLGLFESRKKSQVAIEKGLVSLKRKGQLIKVLKVSEEIETLQGDEWVIEDHPEFNYVSRAGSKLAGALDKFGKSVDGLVCLDIGLSTGGFSDCLLGRGAALVIGVDVGQAQLHPKLQNHPKLKSFDKINAREPLPKEVLAELPKGTEQFDFFVIDVSFISLLKVLTPQLPLLKTGGEMVVLVKPQFEAGPGQLNKKGVIDKAEGLLVLQKTVSNMESLGLRILATSESILVGEDGNQEFFVYCSN